MAEDRADSNPAARADNRIARRNGPRGWSKWKLRCTRKSKTRRQHYADSESDEIPGPHATRGFHIHVADARGCVQHRWPGQRKHVPATAGGPDQESGSDQPHRFGSVPRSTSAIQPTRAVDWNPAGTAAARSAGCHKFQQCDQRCHELNYRKEEIEICLFQQHYLDSPRTTRPWTWSATTWPI